MITVTPAIEEPAYREFNLTANEVELAILDDVLVNWLDLYYQYHRHTAKLDDIVEASDMSDNRKEVVQAIRTALWPAINTSHPHRGTYTP